MERGITERLRMQAKLGLIGGLWFGGVTSLLGREFNSSNGGPEKIPEANRFRGWFGVESVYFRVGTMLHLLNLCDCT
jgi:hypothetical protein